MEPIIYGYIRVSTKEQCEDRQLIALRDFPVCDDKILSLTLVKVKNGYKPSNYAGCSHSPFRNDLCYFFVSSVLVLFIMLRIVDFEINS